MRLTSLFDHAGGQGLGQGLEDIKAVAVGQGLESAGDGISSVNNGGVSNGSDSNGTNADHGVGSGIKRRPSMALQDKIRMFESRSTSGSAIHEKNNLLTDVDVDTVGSDHINVIPVVMSGPSLGWSKGSEKEVSMTIEEIGSTVVLSAEVMGVTGLGSGPGPSQMDYGNVRASAVTQGEIQNDQGTGTGMEKGSGMRVGSEMREGQKHFSQWLQDSLLDPGPGPEGSSVCPLSLIQRLSAVVSVRRLQKEIDDLRKQLHDIDADYRIATATSTAAGTATTVNTAATTATATSSLEVKATTTGGQVLALGIPTGNETEVQNELNDELNDELEHVEVARSVVTAHLHRLQQQLMASLEALGLQSIPGTEPGSGSEQGAGSGTALRGSEFRSEVEPAVQLQHKTMINMLDYSHMQHDSSYRLHDNPDHNNHNNNNQSNNHNNNHYNHNHHIDYSHNVVAALIAGLNSNDDNGLIPETRATLLHLSAALIAQLSQQRDVTDRKEMLSKLLKESVDMFGAQRERLIQVLRRLR